MVTLVLVGAFEMDGVPEMVIGSTVRVVVSAAGGVMVFGTPSIREVMTGACMGGSVTGGRTMTQGNQHEALGVLNPHHQLANVRVWLG
jgi:hypothetical protein